MIIISHRGYWKVPEEKNKAVAFRRSFDLGFGTETDVRDLNGQLVISHDIPTTGAMSLSEFLELTHAQLPLALNIKSDGLAWQLAREMASYDRSAWFVFDMAIPDMRMHLNAGNPVFARMSEVEKVPAWSDECDGIWLDNFDGEWFDEMTLSSLLDTGKRVCVVSSELHRRDYLLLWKMLLPLAARKNLMLCTDVPEQAQEFFRI